MYMRTNCGLKFHNEVRVSFVKDLSKYRSVLSFSVWTGFGAIASVGQSQGGALIVNMFFKTYNSCFFFACYFLWP